MAVLNKLITLFITKQSLMDNSRLLKNFLSHITAILVLFLLIAMSLGTLVIGGLYTGYLALMNHGWTNNDAFLLLGGIVFGFTVLFSVLAFVSIKKLRRPTIRRSSFETTITDRLTNISNAFMDGLLKRN